MNTEKNPYRAPRCIFCACAEFGYSDNGDQQKNPEVIRCGNDSQYKAARLFRNCSNFQERASA